MAGVVVELNKRKSAAVAYLSGKHEADLIGSHLRVKVDDTLDVLNGVTVAVAVAEAAVDEGSCS